jgi:hypothetical protein
VAEGERSGDAWQRCGALAVADERAYDRDMAPDRIRELIHTVPFKPFVIQERMEMIDVFLITSVSVEKADATTV